MRNILSAGLAAAILLPVLSGTALAQQVIRFSNWLPPTHALTTNVLKVWADNIAKDSQGRIRIEFLPALGKPAAHFDLVRDGVADAAFVNPSYTADRFKSAYGVTFPGLADDSESASVAYWRTYKEHFEKLKEYDGTQVLGMWTLGPNHIFTSSKKIQSIADLHGIRLRATGGIVQDISTLIGIVPQFAAVTETYELLSRRVVDGVMFNWDSVVSFRLKDILKNAYVIPGGLFRDTHNVVMNEKVYRSLSDADRAIVDKHSGEAFARLAGKFWDRVDAAAQQDLEKAGYAIVTASPADVATIAERGNQLTEKWLATMKSVNFDGKAALGTFKKHVAQVAAEKK